MIKSIHFYNSVLHDFRLTHFGGTDYQANLSISEIMQNTDLKMNGSLPWKSKQISRKNEGADYNEDASPERI